MIPARGFLGVMAAVVMGCASPLSIRTEEAPPPETPGSLKFAAVVDRNGRPTMLEGFEFAIRDKKDGQVIQYVESREEGWTIVDTLPPGTYLVGSAYEYAGAESIELQPGVVVWVRYDMDVYNENQNARDFFSLALTPIAPVVLTIHWLFGGHY